MTKSEAIRLFKKYGVVHDILMEDLHNPKIGEDLKKYIKLKNDETSEKIKK